MKGLQAVEYTVMIHPAAEVMLHPNLLQLPMEQLGIGGVYTVLNCPLWVSDWFKHVFFEVGLKGYH